ncbi:GNAT family N-acetyltransferase, partial [Bacillus sp. B-TM1]
MHSKVITKLTDLETAFHIRREVFVKEQNVP